MILASYKPGDLVFDLFSGSGTTAAAASKLGRRFLALDASPCALYILRARQLKIASALSLLEGEHALLLEYPADQSPAHLSASVQSRRNGRVVCITEAAFSPAHPIVYAAVGSVEGERFLAAATDCRPALPLDLPLEGLVQPVVEICDIYGRQAFFTLD